jgi:hypothetical protein
LSGKLIFCLTIKFSRCTIQEMAKWTKTSNGTSGNYAKYELEGGAVRVVKHRKTTSRAVKDGCFTVGRESRTSTWYSVEVRGEGLGEVCPDEHRREWHREDGFVSGRLEVAKRHAEGLAAGEIPLYPTVLHSHFAGGEHTQFVLYSNPPRRDVISTNVEGGVELRLGAGASRLTTILRGE